jgi:hypothetical protein
MVISDKMLQYQYITSHRKTYASILSPFPPTPFLFLFLNILMVNKRFPTTPITFERKKLWFPPAVMCSLFEGPINSILSCVRNLLTRLNCEMDCIFFIYFILLMIFEPGDIFLVGGFSKSVILKESMIQEFQSEFTKVRGSFPKMTIY